MVFKAASLKRCLPFEDSYFNHDKWIISNIALWGKFRFVNEKLFSYRLHNSNHSLRDLNMSFSDRVKKLFDFPAPFYSDQGMQRIKALSQGRNSEIFEPLMNDCRKFVEGNLIDRVRFALRYRNVLFLEKQSVKRMIAVLKLPFIDRARLL